MEGASPSYKGQLRNPKVTVFPFLPSREPQTREWSLLSGKSNLANRMAVLISGYSQG